MSHPLTLSGLAAVSLVLSLIGPFGTLSYLPLLPRLLYWTILTVAGYVSGYLFSYLLLRRAVPLTEHLLRILAAGLLTGGAMLALVSLLNRIVFRVDPFGPGFGSLALTTFVISVIVMAVLDLFTRQLSTTPTGEVVHPAPAPILERLPVEKRGPLVALSVEDHYVHVRTTKGAEMVLLRLSDAMREVGDQRGAQVHRSHWAAFDQVRSVTRDGDRAVLHMSAGGDIPVSRRHIPVLKEAGLLPR